MSLFSDVYRAKFQKEKESTIDVAVKVCRTDPNETAQSAKETREAMQSLVREGNIMQHYKHENVIQVCLHYIFIYLIPLFFSSLVLSLIRNLS